ncbi:MAG TPA: DNA-directed RNA polymerase subunit omega [Fimbriimonadaceae bacterium]|nr:DNA-directed RNA polymerase subunit omega [Fimbriimonadaceae bacterium]
MANDPILPQPDVLNEAEYGKFVLTNLAAKRAKQIKEGAPPLVRIESSHPLSIALAEIAAGKIKPLIGEEAEAAMAEQMEAMEEMERERFLLPGLEDDEFTDGLDDDESDDDDEVAATSTSLLANLLGEEEDEEPEIDASDSDEISLDDLAAQEGEEDEESAEE